MIRSASAVFVPEWIRGVKPQDRKGETPPWHHQGILVSSVVEYKRKRLVLIAVSRMNAFVVDIESPVCQREVSKRYPAMAMEEKKKRSEAHDLVVLSTTILDKTIPVYSYTHIQQRVGVGERMESYR
jgi:hypothetical protein